MVKLIYNMSQEQQNPFLWKVKKDGKIPESCNAQGEPIESQSEQGVQDQLGQESDQDTMRTKVAMPSTFQLRNETVDFYGSNFFEDSD